MTIDFLVQEALKEDMPTGDITTESLLIKNKFGIASLIAKEDLVLSGTEFFEKTVLSLDPQAEVKWYFKDSELVLDGQEVCQISGDQVQLLKAERVGLNFLGPLSGIATLTRLFVNETKGSKTKILDTRKTFPLYREWQKKAVRDGGGQNHRINLSDGILAKENHFEMAGGFVNGLKTLQNSGQKFEVEVTNLEELKLAIEYGAYRVMLDNMTNDEMKEALELIPSTIETEASGNMKLERIASVAALGVDFISVGALTHSAPCADLSLLFHLKKES